MLACRLGDFEIMLLRSPLTATGEEAMTETTILRAYESWLASVCLEVTLIKPNPGEAAREPDNQMQTCMK